MARTIAVTFKVNEEEKALLNAAADSEADGNLAEFCRSSSIGMATAQKTSGAELRRLEELAGDLLRTAERVRTNHDVEFASIIRTKTKLEEKEKIIEEERSRFNGI